MYNALYTHFLIICLKKHFNGKYLLILLLSSILKCYKYINLTSHFTALHMYLHVCNFYFNFLSYHFDGPKSNRYITSRCIMVLIYW